MCCIDRIIDFKPSSMPDLGISLDKVFYPDFDISITNDRVRILFFITDSKSEMKMRIVKELRNGVAYNRARNELYVWFTDDELLKMKGHTVLVEVEISDIFTNSLAYSTIETINVDPIIKKRCTYSTSFNKVIPNEVKNIILDKTKSKPWIRPSDRYDPVRYAWKIAHGDLFPNVYELAEEKGFENLMKLVDWDTHNPYLECLFHDTHHQPFYDGNHTNREKEKPMKTKKDIDRIVITKNDLNEVLLRAYSGNEIVEKTIAKCSPDDIFDFNIGAKLAVDRLYDGYDMTPKPKRKLYNGKIFMRADMRSVSFNWCRLESKITYNRENKIWDVKDGKIIGFGGALRPVDLIYEDMTDEELTKLLTKSNSLYVGYFYNIVDGYFVR